MGIYDDDEDVHGKRERAHTIVTVETKPGDKVLLNDGTYGFAPRHPPKRRHTIEATDLRPGESKWLSQDERQDCCVQLQKSTIFKYCSPHSLNVICQNAEKKHYQKGDVVIKQNDPQVELMLLATGNAIRLRDIQGQVHQMEIPERGRLFGSLHFLRSDPAFATLKCTTDVTIYHISRESFRRVMASTPVLSEEIIYGLSKEIRHYNKLMRTPLLEQQQQKIPVLPTSIAAGIESYYRSTMNALINQSITGVKPQSYLPNMHVQLPTRVLYINGFKGIRYYLDRSYDKNTASNAFKLGMTVIPGVVMTPVSSILEASNAGHMNPEPLWRRAMRGFLPRCAREIIFGIGLNQLSDYCEERTPPSLPGPLRNALGSVTAGVIAGYLSHVPHNLSTLKLLTPKESYLTHYKTLVSKSEERIPKFVKNPTIRALASYVLTVIAPKGLVVRTAQIVGSYVVLNGTIYLLKDV